MKDKLGRNAMKDFGKLRAKTYRYLIDVRSEDKKAKGTKKCIINRKFNFEHYKNRLEQNQLENKTNYL